jgi:hypothetical protein
MNSEELIKDLCIRAIKAEGDDFPLAAEVLHAALKAHIKSVRVMAAGALLNPEIPPSDLPQA